LRRKFPRKARQRLSGPVGEPMTEAQLNQLVAPIALYPDSLVAQVLAASTYPTQVVEADRWLQSQGNAPASQIAAGADAHTWDASVKALCAFPSVLAQMDKNIQWTTDLGNAYYNQPQDVMDAVQGMRHKAQGAGNLRSTPQQVVAEQNDAITIAPANPEVVYVPAYDPWAVWGYPVAMYRAFTGERLRESSGAAWRSASDLASASACGWLGLGLGSLGLRMGSGLGGHGVFYNHGMYTTHSATVMNRGFGGQVDLRAALPEPRQLRKGGSPSGWRLQPRRWRWL